jgi:hypothetical protein
MEPKRITPRSLRAALQPDYVSLAIRSSGRRGVRAIRWSRQSVTLLTLLILVLMSEADLPSLGQEPP